MCINAFTGERDGFIVPPLNSILKINKRLESFYDSNPFKRDAFTGFNLRRAPVLAHFLLCALYSLYDGPHRGGHFLHRLWSMLLVVLVLLGELLPG